MLYDLNFSKKYYSRDSIRDDEVGWLMVMDEESEILFYFTEFLSIQKSKVLDIGEYPF